LPPGTAGTLQLRITLDADGNPERVEVDRSASTAKLLGGKLEQCVVAAFKKQKFSAPRSGAEVLLKVPLQFRPTQ
jgi:TonB family protein